MNSQRDLNGRIWAAKKPTNATEMREFLNRRATVRPRADLPPVQIDGATATIRLFDRFDSAGEWWGMSAKEFASAVDDLPSHITTIELLINSPGGEAWEGIAIVNVMRAHPARTVAVVQGIAASAASVIAVAADETIMSPNSTLMIHDAWGLVVGNADDMRSTADILDQLSDNLADIYAAKSGETAAAMRDVMKNEGWYTADEAVAAKLADRVAEPASVEPAAKLNVMTYVAPTVEPPAAPQPAAASVSTMIAANAHRRRR